MYDIGSLIHIQGAYDTYKTWSALEDIIRQVDAGKLKMSDVQYTMIRAQYETLSITLNQWLAARDGLDKRLGL